MSLFGPAIRENDYSTCVRSWFHFAAIYDADSCLVASDSMLSSSVPSPPPLVAYQPHIPELPLVVVKWKGTSKKYRTI